MVDSTCWKTAFAVLLLGIGSGVQASTTPVPSGLKEAVAERLRQIEPITVDGSVDRFQSSNHGQKLRFIFEDGSLTVQSGEARLDMRLARYGTASATEAVEPAVAKAKGNRIEYRREAITEWYINHEHGLEQGFTLHRAPDDTVEGEPIVLALAIDGNLTPQWREPGRDLQFVDSRDVAVLRYNKLKIWDADRQPIAGKLALEDGELQIRLEAAGARFPIHIDPLIYNEQKIYTSRIAQGGGELGWTIAMDGNLALVGTATESAYLYEQQGDSWVELAKLEPEDPGLVVDYGPSVALDNDTAVLGVDLAPCANGTVGCGAAFVFVKPGTGWTDMTETAELRPRSFKEGPGYRFGFSVSIAGETILVGAPYSDYLCDAGDFCGAAYIFEQPVSGWADMTETTALIPTEIWTRAFRGYSVSLTEEVALVGTPGTIEEAWVSGTCPAGFCGGAYIYVEPASGWTDVELHPDGSLVMQPSGVLYASDQTQDTDFGSSVSMLEDVALIGAMRSKCTIPNPGPSLNNECGAAYLFEKPVSGWGEGQGQPGLHFETVKLIPPEPSGADWPIRFGMQVDLSGDLALIGRRNSVEKSVVVFERPATGWSDVTQGVNLTEPGPGWDDFAFEFAEPFGFAASGSTILVGAPKLDCDTGGGQCGGVYVYEEPASGWMNVAESADSDDRFRLTVDGVAGQLAGQAAAVSGDIAVVGAPGENCGVGSQCGAAYVYARDRKGWNQGWNRVARLTASDADAGDQFGHSAAIFGDTVVVGAHRDNCAAGSSCGSAYVFEMPVGGWGNMTETAKLTSSDRATNEQWFGYSVSVWGETVLVGGRNDNCAAGSSCGSVYVFEMPVDGWADMTETAKLTAAGAAAGDSFGISVSMYADLALVGAPAVDCSAGPSCGAAFLFEKPLGGWADMTAETAKLTASDEAAEDGLGVAVAIRGDTAVAGARGDACVGAGTGCGSVSVFEKPAGGWADTTQTAKLTSSEFSDFFGSAVSLFGDTIAVGDIDAFCGAISGCGAAYIYQKPGAGWSDATETSKLEAFDGAQVDAFGASVAIFGDTVLSGAPGDDCSGGNECGAAYAYTFECGFSTGIVANEWTAFGLPCDPGTTVRDELADDLAEADYGSRWVVYEWDASTDQYLQLTLDSVVVQGTGYWIKSLDPVTIDVNGTRTPLVTSAECTDPDGCYEVALTPPSGEAFQWNLVGHSLPFPVNWANVRVVVDGTAYTLADAETNGYMERTIHKWTGAQYAAYADGHPSNPAVLESYDGYWVKVLSGATGMTVKLLVPAAASPLAWRDAAFSPADLADAQAASRSAVPWWLNWVTGAHAANGGGKHQAKDWFIRLSVEDSAGKLVDRNDALGQAKQAAPGYDNLDLKELAPFVSPYLTVVFPHPDWGEKAGDYSTDFHPLKSRGADEWTFEVRTDRPGRTVSLYWEGDAERLSASGLIDAETGTEIPVLTATGGLNSYTFVMQGTSRKFTWRYNASRKGGEVANRRANRRN